MNLFQNKTASILTLLTIWTSVASALPSSNPLCRMDPTGNVVAVWNALDENSNPILQASTLPFGETTWTTPVNISYALGTNITNNPPSIYSNGNGDIVVLWQYVDNTDSQFFTAATMLPAGESTWNTATVSTSGENANYGDHRLALNDNGNLVLLWTSTISGNSVIRVSTSTIGTSTTWSTPVSITD